jgi:hypothetical protein
MSDNDILAPMIEQLDDEALLLDPQDTYNGCIVGTTMDGRAVYDAEKVIDAGILLFGDYESSSEWHNYNTFNAYHGEMTPIFMFTID